MCPCRALPLARTASSPPLRPCERILMSSFYFLLLLFTCYYSLLPTTEKRVSLTAASSAILTRALPWERVPVLPVINGVSVGTLRLPQALVTQVFLPLLELQTKLQRQRSISGHKEQDQAVTLYRTCCIGCSLRAITYISLASKPNLPIVLPLLFCLHFPPALQTQ